MKFLLAAINAKYIHSNLGVYSLRRYALENVCRGAESGPDEGRDSRPEIEMAEYTINHQMERILEDIYRQSPDVVGFSCYIWNILYVKEIVRDLKKVMPGIHIWLGGPEVSYDAAEVLRELPEAELVMMGEGEQTFAGLVRLYEQSAACPEAVAARQGDPEKDILPEGNFSLQDALSQLPGITFRGSDGAIRQNGPAPLLNLDEIPFVYGDLSGMEHRIIYYESSRGCPFSCSYCLSSIDKSVRFRSLDLVKRELAFFLEHRVPQVKFVDRTFNCKKSHAIEIWRFLAEHDNGVTNFHFEISADLLDEEELALLERMRPGLIQLEIGVQTTNPDTIREIRRKMDLGKLECNVRRINEYGNIHQHLDLIAGLPFEGFESFRRSFNDVYRMEPEQLQLGFLKVLKGSHMEKMAEDYGLLCQTQPPYEVLTTKWLDYGSLIRLKGVEEMVEVYYNSGQFRNVMGVLAGEFETPFDLYEQLARFYMENGLGGVSHSRLARYEILFRFTEELPSRRTELEEYRDLLMYDLYLRENVKSRPFFARDPAAVKDTVKAFFRREAESPFYLRGYEGYDSRQLIKMAHMEPMRDGSFILFDYKNRDALLGNARAVHLSAESMEKDAPQMSRRPGRSSMKRDERIDAEEKE